MGYMAENGNWLARVIEIRPASELASNSSDPVAILRWTEVFNEMRHETGCFPLATGQELKLDEVVIVTPLAKIIEGKSVTTYKLTSIPLTNNRS